MTCNYNVTVNIEMLTLGNLKSLITLTNPFLGDKLSLLKL